MSPAPETPPRIGLAIAVTVAVNALVVFFTAINADAVNYALIAKEMAVSGDWADLRLLGQDWLDKPHLPFWLTALSFRVFGITEFAYVLPGLLAHLVGAAFTYRLAKHFYGRATAWVAALMVLSALRLLWATADVRAEAYLVAEIVGALWFWVRYDDRGRARDLVGGALCSGLALMTKGPFVLLVIGSGLACDWLRRGQWRHLVRPKWLLALALTLVVTLPELVALWLQFDSHPEKVVHGRTGVSGIRFFFWEGQFGRYFNTGPIRYTKGDPFFFVHTFAWACLPWTLFAVAAVATHLRRRKALPESERRPFFLFSTSFLVPFVLFSLTTFQADNYIDLVLPFAAILAARFAVRWLPEVPWARAFCRLHVAMAVSGAVVVLALCVLVFRDTPYLWAAALPLGCLVAAVLTRSEPLASRALLLPLLTVNAFFGFFVLATRSTFERYDAGYQLARELREQPRLPLLDYGARSKTLAFHAPQPYRLVERLDAVDVPEAGAFVVTPQERVEGVLRTFPSAAVLGRAHGTQTNRLVSRLLGESGWVKRPDEEHLVLLRVDGFPPR